MSRRQTAIGNNITQGNDFYTDCTFNSDSKTGLSKILELYKSRIESEPAAGKFIQDLSDYMSPRPDREIIGLEEKLKAGDRKDLIRDAEYLKLKFSKKLVANELSESVQTIFMHILAQINTVFAQKINPLISANEDNMRIDEAVFAEIVDPIYKDISSADIGITYDHIRGMLYFLTGNCHIVWKS